MFGPLLSLVMALSILTLNCDCIRDQTKRSGLVQWLQSLPCNVDVDVVCFRETHSPFDAEC